MKKLAAISAIILISLFMGTACRGAAVKAVLIGVKGDVQVQPSDGANWAAATEGMTVSSGASIKTGAGAEASVKWGAANAVKISQLSMVRIDTLLAERAGGEKSDLSLQKGKVLAKADKLKTKDSVFLVKTPTAIAGVRGTTFECDIAPETNQVTVSVVEGTVFVAVGEVEQMVMEGFASSVMPGELPQEPAAIPPEKMEELKSEADSLKATIQAVAPVEKPKEEKAASDTTAAATTTTAADAAMTNTVEEVTIQNQINETAEEILRECTGGGGCIRGNIEF